MWSPQRYIQQGQRIGRNRLLLEHAVEQIERLILRKPSLPAILTLGHLAARTGTNYSELREIVANSSAAYKHFRIRKRSGGHRLISTPQPRLMKVQRWVTAYVLKPLPSHHRSFAFSDGASIYRCAAQHCGARWLQVSLDRFRQSKCTVFFRTLVTSRSWRLS